MVGDLLGAVVGDVADDHPVAVGGVEVDVVVADPGADHALAARGARRRSASPIRAMSWKRRMASASARNGRKRRLVGRAGERRSGRRPRGSGPRSSASSRKSATTTVNGAGMGGDLRGGWMADRRGPGTTPLVIHDRPGRFNAVRSGGVAADRVRRVESGSVPGMPRIKQLLADGQFVRMFGVGQLYQPEADRDRRRARRVRRPLARRRARRARHEGRSRSPRWPRGPTGWTTSSGCRRPTTPRSCASLEAGAGGVMVSMVRSPEEAEQAVRWAKF